MRLHSYLLCVQHFETLGLVGVSHRGAEQAKKKLPSVGAGPWEGRWTGNGQFHLIKHSCRIFIFLEENKSKGWDRGGSSVGHLAFLNWSPGGVN